VDPELLQEELESAKKQADQVGEQGLLHDD
jgi:hypothetical protein